MSKDIRSYFSAKNQANNQKKTFEFVDSCKKKPTQRKRAAIVIDSDSDEESNISLKRSKPLKEEEKIKTSSKKEYQKTTSKYFDTKNVSASDIFGARPVKRDNTRKIVKKESNKEFHIDKVFESELLNFNDIPEELLVGNPVDSQDNVETCKKSGENENNKGSFKSHDEKMEIEQNTNVSGCNESPNKKIKTQPKKTPQKDRELDKNSNDNTFKCSQYKIPSPVISETKNLRTERSPLKKLFSPVKSQKPTEIQNSSPLSKKDNSKVTDSFKHLISPSKPKLGTIKDKPETDLVLNKFSDTTLKKQPVSNSVSVENMNKSSTPCNLWVERYKPMSTKQIIGQQGDKSCVNKLTNWLKSWHRNHSGNKKLVKPSPWAKNDDGAFFKAALLSGPPGVGKTTTSHLVCKELGFDVVEFNASDTRSKKLLHQEVSELLSTNSLSPFFTGKHEQVTKKHLLLMDEVDGMAGNEDRGGVQELILLIKQSRIPIICMCNDRNHPKIRSLANYCFDLRFSKPRAEQIKGAMMSVCFKEKLKIAPDVLTEIIKSADQDIRLVLNHLSMLSIDSKNLSNSTKHIKLGAWDVVRKIFSEEEHKSMTIYDKCDLFFHDYSIIPLFVQENYLNAVIHKPEGKNKVKKMVNFASAAKSLSFGDMVEKNIRSRNAWSLLPVQAVFMSLVPGETLEGHLGAQISFPTWFGKNSRQTKMNRLLQELTVHSRLKISGNKEAMNLDYAAALERNIVEPLIEHGLDGISRSLDVLSEYCLIREDLESLSEVNSWPNAKNKFSEVETKVKSAFTRAYNKNCSPTPYAVVPIKKGSRLEIDNSEDIAEEDDVDNDDEDNVEVDSMIVVKKKTTNKREEKESKPSSSKGSKVTKRGRRK